MNRKVILFMFLIQVGCFNGDDLSTLVSSGETDPPIIKEAGVMTILLALYDQDNMNSPSIETFQSQAVILKAIEYASKVDNPKILLIRDHNHHYESYEDTDYIFFVLGLLYDVDLVDETNQGLSAEDFVGYDVVWINNPGYPFGSINTYNALEEIKETKEVGIVISGDDMARGKNFNASGLTGLQYLNNGTRVCSNRSDNNQGVDYYVNLDEGFFDIQEAALEPHNFYYGNDIDHTLLSADVSVMAEAFGPPGIDCDFSGPVIVGYKLEAEQEDDE